MSSKRQQIEELHEELDELRETTEKLKAEYGLDDEDEADKENVEVPAAGRTNWEADRGDSIEPSTDSSSGETHTEEVEIPAAGRTNEATATIEREVGASRTMAEIAEGRAEMHELLAEGARERVERQRTASERLMSSGPYAPDDDETDDDLDVPAGGRSNWEARQEGDD